MTFFLWLNYTQRDFCVSYLYEIHILPFAGQPSVVSVKADTHLVCVFLRFGECAFQSTASIESGSRYPENRCSSGFPINQIQKISSHRSYNDWTMFYWHCEKTVSVSASWNSAPFVLHTNNVFNWLKPAKKYPIKCHYMTSVKCSLWKSLRRY